ncbi:hypothetical protein QUN99_003324 [Vibrio parahaemolyticus]|nr:hypothetical protein [Vibrio parahaemolyticus]
MAEPKSHYTTEELALYMAGTGKKYTASTLAKELGIEAQFVTGKLNNLEKCHNKYKMEISDSSPRLYRCISVKGHISNHCQQLLKAVLF